MAIKQMLEDSFTFTQEQVKAFADSTGDNNPIHLDEEYAAKSIFGRRIVHGMLSASVFSKIFGTVYPGEGTIYVKQSLTFMAPIYVDENYTARITLIEFFDLKFKAIYKTEILDSKGDVKLTGEATIINKSLNTN